MLPGLGRVLVIFGAVLAAVGLILMVAPKVPWLGRLPGDIYYRRDNFRFYFPLGTSIVVSIVLTLLLNLLLRIFRR